MNDEVELALFALLREHAQNQAGPDRDPRFDQFLVANEQVNELTSVTALGRLAANANLEDCEDLVAAIQGLVLGSALGVAAEAIEYQELAAAILATVGVEADRAQSLIGVTSELRAALGSADDPRQSDPMDVRGAINGFQEVFAPRLTIRDSSPGHVTFSGRAAAVAALVTEATTLYATKCTADVGVYDRTSQRYVTRVAIEVCTALPFDECRRRIDPMRWPDCNPYFFSVVGLTHFGVPSDWYGSVRENVGPAINRDYYETDLLVRYIEATGVVATAFDLVPDSASGDDERVSVDRGYLAVIEEGSHRRVQMLKVYRIEHFEGGDHEWICPLWAQQLALAGWSCQATVPMRRALKAWSKVTRHMVDLGHHVCESANCHCDQKSKKATKSKVLPISPEHYDVVLPSSCRPSFTGMTGQVCVPVTPAPAAAKAPAYDVVNFAKAELAHKSFTPATATVSAGPTDDQKLISLDKSSPGLFLGWLKSPAGGVTSPFTLYDDGI